MEKDKSVPLWKMYSLSVAQASQYYGIGETRIYRIIRENPDADFILTIGSHIRIKREMFQKYLDRATAL